jgi:ABC-2 type transport system ATP-binding protein
MFAVEARGLVKKYKTKTAVKGLDLSVEEGELFALLGVNGAGKTTTIRMLCCLSTPTEGEGFICGNSVLSQQDEVKRIIGISPQDTAVADKLTVRENLIFMAGIQGFEGEKKADAVEKMIKIFKMQDCADQKAASLSGGWKRKLSIAMALIGEPKVLFLDEPTLGLDVLARRELWKVIKELKSRITIILTTHYMEEAEALADRIAVMVNGELKAVGTLAELEALTGQTGLENAFVAIAEGGDEV